MLTCHLRIFFGELSVSSFTNFLIDLFVFLLFSLKSSFILGNCPLLDVSFANISSQSMPCL